MKMFLWLAGIVAVTIASGWIWLRWVNAPSNEIMSVPRQSMESQVLYIKSKYPCRLVRAVATKQPDVYSPWAIAESNRRTLVLAALWLAIMIIWTLILYRLTPAA
jgi:hypothetical protein